MASKIDAVVAALEATLRDVAASRNPYWNSEVVNRWVDELPGAWWGRWRRLRLPSTSTASASEIIPHLNATLAYLKTHRDAVEKSRGALADVKPSVALEIGNPVDRPSRAPAIPPPPASARNRSLN